MSKNLNIKISILLDFYGGLLTEKQYEAVDLYYNEDLSLSEIAEHTDITRYGVRDRIVKSEKILYETEEKLHLAERFNEMKILIDNFEKNKDKYNIDEIINSVKELLEV
ncbi:MAG: DNA-binding protein [Oscillospiraceae bacterium]|nr:DNA-binding protein [Oscillospiraceae bacterium]